MKKTLLIPAMDGFQLTALLFQPTISSKGTILVCPGLGIPKTFYENYCQFLAQQGYVALVFDYRGIGKKTSENTSYEINLRNWGMKDMSGIIGWLKKEYPNQKLYVFAHSIGGQVAGLMPNHNLVDRFFFISSTTGYWTSFNFPLNVFSWFMFNIHIPITTRLAGYMPKSLTYRGVAIAKEVALEWAAWSRKKKYIAAFLGNQIPVHFYDKITQQIDWIWFADDAIATEQAVTSMMAYYPNARIKQHFFDPKTMNLSRIGHAGFFSRKGKELLWEYPLKLIQKEESN